MGYHSLSVKSALVLKPAADPRGDLERAWRNYCTVLHARARACALRTVACETTHAVVEVEGEPRKSYGVGRNSEQASVALEKKLPQKRI